MRLYPFFLTHEGCPNRCLFCRQERSAGEHRFPSADEISRTLERLLPPQGDGEVAFYGGTFTLLPIALQSDCLSAVQSFLRAGRVGGIRISTRPDAIGDETIPFLKRYGVTTVEIGCQSFSEDVLRAVGRTYAPSAVASATRRLKEAGFRTGLQLMPGLPEGGRGEAVASLERALDLSPDFLRIYPAVVLRGTGLEALYRSGSYSPFSIEEGVDCCAELLWYCHRRGIPVIRTGLQGTAEMDSGEAWVAGPYHPAFGQLVRSRIWFRALERGALLSGGREALVASADLSDALGHRKENMTRLRERFGAFDIRKKKGVARESLTFNGLSDSIWNLAEYTGEY